MMLENAKVFSLQSIPRPLSAKVPRHAKKLCTLDITWVFLGENAKMSRMKGTLVLLSIFAHKCRDKMEEAKRLKEEGNQLFKSGQYEDALTSYTQALKLGKGTGEEGVYLKNRAACLLKLDRYEEAITDTSAALEISPNDPKALFRRCQAAEKLERYEEAYRDALKLLQIEPKNTAIQPALRRLLPIVQERAKQHESTDNKVTQMFDFTFKDTLGDPEKRLQACNNLIVLAREEAGADKIFKADGVARLVELVDGQDAGLKLTAIRVLACMANNSQARAKAIKEHLTLPKLSLLIASASEDISTAASLLLQNIITWVSDHTNIKKAKEEYEAKRKADLQSSTRPFGFIAEKIEQSAREEMSEILDYINSMINQAKVSAVGRDNILELLIKFSSREFGVGWTRKIIEGDTVHKLMEVAGTIPEHKTVPISENTRMHTSVLLSKIYDDLFSDQEREMYRKQVDTYLEEMFGDNIHESKTEAIMAIAALLQGPYEVGNLILGREGILPMMMAMADSANPIHIKVAVEALVYATSKKDKCTGIIKQATPILKQLYHSQNDAIKVRALVGLCKLGSVGGADASAKSFAEGSTKTLAKACRKYLCNPSKNADLRKWAAEGLAYLSLDADVKEDLVEDTEAVSALLELAKSSDKSSLYPISQVLVNVTNSYDKPKIEPELLELAKYSKHHIPEEHEKDKEEYVKLRVKRLVTAGVVNALVCLAKTESDSCKELLARVFLAVAMEQEYRGLIVQQGGAKALIPLANEGNIVGKAVAAQALAKIAITTNPEIAFPGQRACEVVRPLLQLLHIEKTALQNFEALMALTNLAQMSESVRKRIVKETGLPQIEHYMFEEHEMLRRAATQCMCNMVLSEEVVEIFEREQTDRVKLLVLYSSVCVSDEEEDEVDIDLVRAASGALAIITNGNKKICDKITTCTNQWNTILQGLVSHPIPDIQHRGACIIMNMMMNDKEIAQKIVDSQLLEILMAVARLELPEVARARECAQDALQAAVDFELIKPFSQQNGS